MVSTNHLGVSKVITNMLTSRAWLYKVYYRSMATVSFKIEDIVENWTQGSCLELPVLYHRAMTTTALETEVTAGFSLWSNLPLQQTCIHLQLRLMFKSRFRLFMKPYFVLYYW